MTITKHETGSALAIRDDQSGFTPQQVAALRQLGVEEATDGDLQVFFHTSQRTGLDPFARQIYMVGRWDNRSRRMKYTIQTGIDGFRLIGRRAADAKRESLEVSDTEWCGLDGEWTDVWLSPEPPAAARVAIIRNGGRFPAVALFREYAQTTKEGGLTPMWATKGALMIAKCAEALAWRKAFPQDLSGLYTADEMAQADNHVTVHQAPTPTQPQPTRTLAEALADDDEPAPAIDWDARITAHLGDVEGLIRLHREATTAGAPADVLEAIVESGHAARAAAAGAALAPVAERVDDATGEVLDAEVIE